MANYQAQAIQTLRNEHRTMAFLLDLLEQQVNLFKLTKRPDYDLIKEVLDYFLTYPDICHHPKENLILRKLKVRNPEAAERVLNLEIEHDKCSERLGEFSRAVINVLLDAEISRETFIDIANEFIQGERAHMFAEEHEFFPVALRCLSEDDWLEIDEKIIHFRDPLAADESLRFALLRECILGQRHSQAS